MPPKSALLASALAYLQLADNCFFIETGTIITEGVCTLRMALQKNSLETIKLLAFPESCVRKLAAWRVRF